MLFIAMACGSNEDASTDAESSSIAQQITELQTKLPINLKSLNIG
jgi:hypothetical protein